MTDLFVPAQPAPATDPDAGSRRGAVLRWLGRVVIWLVLLVSVAVLAVAVVIPRIAGATPYTILTGSMQPGRPPGTLVVVKPTDFDQIRIGDIVTYQLESGKPMVVTHRVTAINVGTDGTRTLTTQGDANDVPDASPVREVQVKGTVWYSIPHLGRISNLLNASQKQTGIYVAAGVLALYALSLYVGDARDRRLRRRATADPHPDPKDPDEHAQ